MSALLITFVGVSSSFVMLAATATSSSAISTTDYFVPGYGMFWDSLQRRQQRHRRRRSAGVGEEYASRRLLVEEEMSHVRRSDDVGHERYYDGVSRWNRLRDAMIFFHPPAPITPFIGGLRSVPPKSTSAHDDEDDDEKEHSTSSLDGLDDISSNSRIDESTSTTSDFEFRDATSAPKKSLKVMPLHDDVTLVGGATPAVTSWAPEDFPDPWSNPPLCMGAMTSSYAYHSGEMIPMSTPKNREEEKDASTKKQQWYDKNLPLFCDPDRVLGGETIHDVISRLRGFADTFAGQDVIAEGVDYGPGEGESWAQGGGGGPPGEDAGQGDDFIHTTTTKFIHDETTMDDKLHSSSRRGGRESRRILHSSSISKFRSIFSSWDSSPPRESDPIPESSTKDERIEIAIALVERINLPAILRSDSYFFYSDQEDMINDAAQYFARYIHDNWSKTLAQERNNAGDASTNLVLIFISTLDRICYISSGNRIAAILPWWRLEHVVQDMKPYLQNGQIGDALYKGIDDLSRLLLTGPPSFEDRVDDFSERFGVVILFTIFTFVFATWGECRDRRKRLNLAERRSRMTMVEREKARLLQVGYRSQVCPICLEPFDWTPEKGTCTGCSSSDVESSINPTPDMRKYQRHHKRVDSLDIPTVGNDDRPIKLLRCGHIFDMTCWQTWVDSGTGGNPWICPVCRQDVGRPKRGPTIPPCRISRGGDGGGENNNVVYDVGRREEDGTATTNQEYQSQQQQQQQQQSSLFARIASGPSMLLRPLTNIPQYNSIQNQNPFGVMRRTLSAPTEHTPLFPRDTTDEETIYFDSEQSQGLLGFSAC